MPTACAGTATVNATVRGSLRDPQMTAAWSSERLALYDRCANESTTPAEPSYSIAIGPPSETLTAETGAGGSPSGALEFGDTLILSLAGRRETGRVRYPEDVSFTSDAQLALTVL